MIAVLILVSLCLANVASSQQPPRDVRRPTTAGTATIAGVVVSGEPRPKPLRRVRVMLNGPELSLGRTAISNDDGTFAFNALPAGRYTVTGTKDNFNAVAYGARRTGRPGTPILVRDNETRRVLLRMVRSSVITGMLMDAEGQPIAGAPVRALTYRWVPPGERRLVQQGSAIATTDDRGEYRVFGLPPGDFIVAAQLRNIPNDDVQVISESEVRKALAEVRSTGARTRPGFGLPHPAPSSSAPPRPLVRAAPVFYPGTTDPLRAATVTLGPAEERDGIDFRLEYVPTATVSGNVSSPPGSRPRSVTLSRSPDALSNGSRSTPVDTSGAFSFSGVTPGNYSLFAGVAGTPGANDSVSSVWSWAALDIVVDGEDVTNLALALQPGLTLSGRVVFEGRKPPPDLSGVRVPLPSAIRGTGTAVVPLPPVQFDSGGTFTIAGVIPGKYRLSTTIPGQRTPLGVWWLKSLTLNGREVLDEVLEFGQGMDDAVITFSDRATELSGTAIDIEGNPLTSHFVIVFAIDRATWFVGSRRVAGTRPDLNGRYAIRNLPPGDYFVAALDDIEQNEWFDPSVLQRLVSAGVERITLRENEKRTHDVKH